MLATLFTIINRKSTLSRNTQNYYQTERDDTSGTIANPVFAEADDYEELPLSLDEKPLDHKIAGMMY